MVRRRAHGLPPALKRLGQHFLTDQRVLDRIAEAVAPSHEPTIIEIGPGRGALTDRLAPRTDRLVTIELDRALVPILRKRYESQPHVSVVEADVLETNLGELAGGTYALAGNVPYYITTPILFHALRRPRAHRAVYLVQREVAERVVAAPGSKEYGALSVNVQALASAELLFRVPPGAFSPPPKVESAVVLVQPLARPAIPEQDEVRYRTIVQESFGLRRKQMRRVIRTILRLDAPTADRLLGMAGVDPESRPETLTPADFARLLGAVSLVAPREGEG